MAENLLTSSLDFIYLTWYNTTEKIVRWLQSVSGFEVPRTIFDVAGLLLILIIFLALGTMAKKAIIGRKKSPAETSIKPEIEEQEHIGKNPEQLFEKKGTNEKTQKPIQQEAESNPVPEQLFEKKETNEIILESEKYNDEFISNSTMNCNVNNLENLINELQRIELMVRLNFENWKKEHDKDTDDFLGLYISENEVNAILQAPPYGLESLSDSVKEKIQSIPLEINRSLEKERSLRLGDLKELFQLDTFEIDALLICLASELYIKYERLYSYLQNDVTKKRPSVDLVINLLCPSIEEKLKAREHFSPTAALIRNRLIYLIDDGHEEQIPLLSKTIKVDERIIGYLLGEKEIDQRIRNFSTKLEPKRSFDSLILDEKNRLKELVKHRSIIPMYYMHGAYGTGKKLTGEAILKELNGSLLIVDSIVLMKGDPIETLKIIIREARLQHSSLYLEGFNALMEKEAGINVTSLVQELDDFPDYVFLSGELPWAPSGILKKHTYIDVVFPIPPFASRKTLFEVLLKENVPEKKLPDNLDIDALASKFNFSGGQIRDAILTALNFAKVRKPEDYKLSMDDLYRGCKAQSNKNLSSFARNIPPRYTWKDIVLPKDLKEQLKEVSVHIKHKGKVYTDWGFDSKLSLGKGLNVLFSGPSGAGKTMAAEVMAKEAGLDLYKIDLSTVVSKYIGETEKILRKIFIEAETSNAILFFDEADALFGKRSEVKDSHDRYANIEINYLLQKMEEHEGIVILASNFKTNIDEAFLRRMHFVIEFPFPDENIRKKIWENIFPEDTPLSEDVDYNFLSTFKISGGNIKNIALSAAFLAADDSGKVKMEHIIRATKREFQKMGKLCTAAEFGEYYDLVK